MLLLIAAVFVLWNWPEAGQAAATDRQASAPEAEAGSAVLASADASVRALPSPAPSPSPSPAFTPAGPGSYVSAAKPDGRRVTPKEDLCYWGMEQLDKDAKIHRCRYSSGSGILLPDYTCGDPVPETEPVGPEWFSDAVFIGNSLAQGFMLWGGLKTADMYAVQSISVGNIATEKVINAGGGNFVTILDAMSWKSHNKVFVMLGINELSWASKETFYDKYAVLIDRIRELQPGAEVYLQSMTPVSAIKSANDRSFTIDRVHEYNEVIRQLAEDKEAHYIYLFDAFADENGFLPYGATDDGIHPYPKYYAQWLTYLESHTVTEVKR